MVPVGTVIGIVGGIVALLILLLLLFLCHRRRKAKNHRFALMGLGSDNVAQNMSQNLTTVATPFTLAPLPSSSTDLNATLDSSRLPLFSTMSEKALRQQTYPNRAETDLEPASTSPDLAPSSNAPAFSVSVPSTHATASNSLNQPSLDLSPLSEPSDSSGPQGPPEPNQAANNDAAYRLRYLSGSTSIAGPVTSAYGGISDVPPAYRPNE
ncbi:hypothetical protein BYT27DRAFT_6926567 [Phlegmacium glaucopus]|nr:hypothetical protein BYT27DRAFT_6926567 [Phlegmacium glaucopus]